MRKETDEHLTAIEMKLAYMEDFVNLIQTAVELNEGNQKGRYD